MFSPGALGFGGLNGVGIGFAGTDADSLFQIHYENLAVADLAGVGGLGDGLDHAIQILVVDCDIDVIDRSQFPGAPGARPGGMSADDFFAAARSLAAEPKVRLVDLTEFDPSLDASDLSALTAGRWVCEILAGVARRSAS